MAESESVLIDVHTHLGRNGAERYTLDALRAHLDATGATHAMLGHFDFSDAGQRLDEVDANLSALRASRRDERVRALYWSRPGQFDSNPYVCAGALEREPFAGVILSPQLHGYDLSDRARTSPILKALIHFGRPLVLYVHGDLTEEAEKVYALGQSWASVPILILGPQSVLTNAAFRDAVQMARKRGDARLWLSTAHSTPEEIVHAVEGLGSQALMYGSDAGNVASEANYKEDMETLRSRLSEDDFANLTCENACDLFAVREMKKAAPVEMADS